jgi:hypothetical protein
MPVPGTDGHDKKLEEAEPTRRLSESFALDLDTEANPAMITDDGRRPFPISRALDAVDSRNADDDSCDRFRLWHEA